MAQQECDPVAVGAYAFGALDPDDAAATERHLALCPRCRDEAGYLAPVRGALDSLPLGELLTSLSLTPERVAEAARRAVERAEAEATGRTGPEERGSTGSEEHGLTGPGERGPTGRGTR